MSNTPVHQPRLRWDSGTAYDFFISLYVLHHPSIFGLRPSWAAGVRSRLPAAAREVLEDAISFFGAPLNWLHSLPAPKTSRSAPPWMGLPPCPRRIACPP